MRHAKARILNKKAILVACVCLLLAIGSVGGVYALLTAQTAPVANEFVPAKVSCSVEEEFSEGVKSNVTVRNTGNVDAYIRATVIATFVSDDGHVLATAPVEDVDYRVLWGENGWLKSRDGFWYYAKPVAAGEVTAPLIDMAYEVTVPLGYRLHIQILATAIQSAPDRAVQEAWGVGVTNGELVSN